MTGAVRRVLAAVLAASICLTSLFTSDFVHAGTNADAQPSLLAKSITIAKGGRQTIKIRNGKGKWSIKNGGIVKVHKKTAEAITIKPVKAGRTVVVCKAGGETLKCKVRVLNNKSGKPDENPFPAIIVGGTYTSKYNIPKGVSVRGYNFNKKRANVNLTTKLNKKTGKTKVTIKIKALKPGRTIITVYYRHKDGSKGHENMPYVFIKGFQRSSSVKKTEANYRKWRRTVISTMAGKNLTTWEMINAFGYLISSCQYNSKVSATGTQLWYSCKGTCVSGAMMMNDFMHDIGVSSKIHFAGNSGMNYDIYDHPIFYAAKHKNVWIKIGGKRYELNAQPGTPWNMGGIVWL